MKKICISTPFPITDEFCAGLNKAAKEELNVELNVKYYDWEEDNQTAVFEIEELTDEIISFIENFETIAIYDGEPEYELNDKGQIIGFPNMIN